MIRLNFFCFLETQSFAETASGQTQDPPTKQWPLSQAQGIPYHPEVIVWFHRAAAELGADVQAAVAKFPDHADKCTPEEEAAWRREPVFVTSAEEKAMAPKL